ncbi:Pyridine nucleotide-disulfide oxidoreductase domain-containing protein 2 [Armadillidium nasatum]|uniref:Pyridine nucleotide-disulfide oxidoreductase domain-containing protein 2 n=1 Tax=Armadillidium nasatum TaxID=96803 RepID=A0A5N5TMR1_9CRUS|nr:Pyridine nucleotide-disulfide oxidoreductase domain-containing protein 2 [Armadillidium nasatum]
MFSGHNGLIAAFYLSRGGKKVCLLERRHTVGGAAVTEEIVPGFKFSRASYVLGLLRPYIYEDLKLYDYGLKVYPRDPSSYTPLHEKFWKDSKARSLTLGLDETQNEKEISKFSVKDAKAFPKYEEMLNKIITSLSPLLDTHPPDLKQFSDANFIKKLHLLKDSSHIFTAAKNLGVDTSRFLQLMTAPISKILNHWFESEPLKATLGTDGVIGSMMSPSSPGSGYVLLHHVMAETNGKMGAWGFPEGGMGAVTQAMAKAATDSGVDIFVEQPVKEILVDSEGVVRGIKTEQGLEIAADLVLSNATPKVTFLDLIPKGKLSEDFEKELKTIDYTSPVCKINVALKGVPNFTADPNPNVIMPHHQCTIHLHCEDLNLIEEAYIEAKSGKIPKKPLIELTLPSSVDRTIAPKNCHVALLFTQYVSVNNEGKEIVDKNAYVQRVFDSVEEYSPGFKSLIVGFEALMPSDLENIYSDLLEGPTATLMGPATPITGLFLCGSGSHPGGGVMGAPGYISAKMVLSQ